MGPTSSRHCFNGLFFSRSTQKAIGVQSLVPVKIGYIPYIMNYKYIYIYVWLNYNISLT